MPLESGGNSGPEQKRENETSPLRAEPKRQSPGFVAGQRAARHRTIDIALLRKAVDECRMVRHEAVGLRAVSGDCEVAGGASGVERGGVVHERAVCGRHGERCGGGGGCEVQERSNTKEKEMVGPTLRLAFMQVPWTSEGMNTLHAGVMCEPKRSDDPLRYPTWCLGHSK